MSQPITVVQRAFLDSCIAYSKFRIVDRMSISVIAHDADSYNALAGDIVLPAYGFCDREMVEKARSLLPDVPGAVRGFRIRRRVRRRAHSAGRMATCLIMPIEQVSFPQDPCRGVAVPV